MPTVGASVRKSTFFPRLLVFLAMVSCACSSQHSSGSHFTVTDSAGIEIVENHQSAMLAAERWSISTEPVLRVETPESGGYTLFRVVQVLPLSQARVAVLNGSPAEVMIFGRDGALESRMGRSGDGPGEFRTPGSLMAWADSVAVWDSARRHLSVFTEEGRLARDLSLTHLWQSPVASNASGTSNEAFFLFTTIGFPSVPVQGISRASSDSYIVSFSGEVLAEMGPFPGNEVFVGGVGMGLVLFGARTFSGASRAGVVVGDSETSEVQVFQPDGTLRRIVRWPEEDRNIGQERIDQFFEVALRETPPAERAAARSMIDQIPVAKRAPAHAEILYPESGEVWVAEYPGPEEIIPTIRPGVRSWMVFDQRGALVATIQTPGGFRPQTVSGDSIFGVFEDSLGVESVRAYRITR